MKKHANIPIFIPHLGCPNQCVFCNQRTISGKQSFDISSVRREIESALATIDSSIETEIAFFGGSFTGIDMSLMINLLEIANEYLKAGRVHSIRCSTRPDYINDEILAVLKKYGIKTIELGLQSCSDKVLSLSKRGHSFKDEEEACRLIVRSGFNLVGQMMIGLPGSELEDELSTAKKIISMGASGARIYPTVVFFDTELCNMALSGNYVPLSTDEAIKRSARVLEVFIDAHTEVIRIGLCAQDNLFDKEKYYGGPNNPALGELVMGELYYNKILEKATNDIKKEEVRPSKMIVKVAPSEISKVIGQKRCNIDRLKSSLSLKKISVVGSENYSEFEFDILFERL